MNDESLTFFSEGESLEEIDFDLLPKESQPGARFVCALLKEGASSLVENAGAVRLEACLIPGVALVPLVVNDGSARECYMVSPYGHYILYLREELKKLTSPVLRTIFLLVTYPIGALCAGLGFNRVVMINNWLLSTSPQLDLGRDALQALTRAVVRRYPDHALVHRCVDEDDDALREDLAATGYDLVVNRPVHWWYPGRWHALKRGRRRLVRADARLWQKSGARRGDASSIDAQRMRELYESLYVSKHSRLNPQYTEAFMEACRSSDLFQLDTVIKQGAPIGFGLFIASPRRVIFNFLGYDTDPAAEAKEIGVFPMIIYRGFERSLESGRNLFLSTGAASFKLIRGTVESLEYEGVSTRHLPIHRRLPWRLVAALFRLGSQNLNSSEI